MLFDKALLKRAFIGLFCLLPIMLVACGGNSVTTTPSSTTKAPANQQILISPVSGTSDIPTFDPALSTDTISISVIDMIFTGLVQLDDHQQVRDQLAASHHADASGTTWTFTLRPNLTFSDGTPLTSADVVYSLDRALDPSLKSTVSPLYLNLILDADQRLAGKMKSLIGVSLLAPDGRTVIIKTKKEAAYFLDSLTYSCSYVIEKSMIEKYGNAFADHLAEGIGGAGPFQVSSYRPGKEIIFVPNSSYYGLKPQLQKVVLPFYQRADTAYAAYQAGQVDAAGVPSAQMEQARSLPGGQFHQVPQLWITYYAMNYLVKPFDNLKIRQAFALALNKDDIARHVYKGTVIPTNHIIPQGMPGYFDGLTAPDGAKGTAGNANLARQLLQQGMQEEGLSTLPPVSITYASGGGADYHNELATAQQMWQDALGISVRIDDVERSKLISEMFSTSANPKGLQMWAYGWLADYPDPQDWLTLQFDAGSPNNTMNYGQNGSTNAVTQQQTQQTMEQADRNQDPASRLQQYHEAEQQLINDVAWLPIYQITGTVVRKPCVMGIVENVQNQTPPDDWGAIYKSTETPCASVTAYQ